MANKELNLLPCAFCGCEMKVSSNRDWHHLTGEHDDLCPFEPDEDTMCVPTTVEMAQWLVESWNRRAAPAQGGLSDALPEGFQRLETVKFWADAFADDPQRVAGAMIVKLLNEYVQLRELFDRGQQGGVSDAADMDEAQWEARTVELAAKYPGIAAGYAVVEVLIETESGCSVKAGEWGFSIPRILHGAIKADDLEAIEDCIAEDISDLKLPTEGITSFIVYESGEWQDVFWTKFYRFAAIQAQAGEVQK